MIDVFEDVAPRLRCIVEEMSAFYLERETTIRNAMLALLSRSHHFLLGPVGSGKSDLHEELASRIEGAEFFITQLHEQMGQADLFGQIDVPAFTRSGAWERRVQGYLPTAHLAMIDELDKGGPGITRQLLRVINERRYRNGAGEELQLPLISVVASANEMLPVTEVAVWDRFLIREEVAYIAEPANFLTLLQGRDRRAGGSTTVTLAELHAAIDMVGEVEVGQGVREALLSMRTQLRGEGVVASDRRWLAAVRLLQASALLDSRAEVGLVDLGVLEHVLWSALEQRSAVAEVVLGHGTPEQKRLAAARRGIDAVHQGLSARQGRSESELGDYAGDALAVLREVSNTLAGIDATQVAPGALSGAREALIAAHVEVMVKCIGMDPARARSRAAEKVPA